MSEVETSPVESSAPQSDRQSQPVDALVTHARPRNVFPIARAAAAPPGDSRPEGVSDWLKAPAAGAAGRARMSAALQRSIGNSRIARMAMRMTDDSGNNRRPDSASAGDPRKDAPRGAGMTVQTKLTVNEPGDVYEQEADRIAEKVTQNKGGPAAPVAGISRVQRKAVDDIEHRCPECERAQRVCAACAAVHRKPAAADNPEVTPETERDIHSRRGGGQPLAPSARNFLEPRFGQDFGGVRVHADAGAAHLAGQLNAAAFTTGQDVFFAQDRYQPDTADGRTLLAHELTHTIQQGPAPAGVSRQDGDPSTTAPAAPPVDAQSVKDAVDIIIKALSGITTAWGSERIVKQFRGKSPSYMRAVMQEIKARAVENGETPQGMVRWLFGDLTAEDRQELRQLLIKNKVLEDLGPILIEELVSDLGGFFGGGAETLELLSQFAGAELDNILRQLESATKKSEDELPGYLFGNLDRVSAEKLRKHFIGSGGRAGNYAAYFTAEKIHKLISGFFGLVSHSESTMVLDLYKSIPADLLNALQNRVNELVRASDGKKAEDLLMQRLDQSDYEQLQQLPGVTLRKFDREVTWKDKLASAGKWALLIVQWGVCGAIGIVTGILAAVWDILKGLWDLVKAAYHLVGLLVYVLSGFTFGRDHWVAVRDFFVSIGTLFAHPISSFDKMWEELATEFQTIEGPFADCKRAEFVIRKFINAIVNIILVFVAGYGIAKAAVSVAAEFAELAEQVGTLRAIGQTAAKAGRAIVKLVPAKLGELGEVGKAFLKPAQTLVKVKRQINGILLAVDKEGVWSYMRGRGGELLAHEREFWRKNREKWRERALRAEEKQAAAEDQIGQIEEGLENNQVPADKDAELQDLDKKANDVSQESDDLEGEMKSDPEKGNTAPPSTTELPKEYIEWENRLSKETQEALQADPELRRTYAEMDPEVRRILTLCESPCIPTKPVPSPADVQRIRKLLDRLKLPEDHQGLREYFHYANRKSSLTTAIDDVENVKSVAELNAKLDEFVIKKAQTLGVTASRGADGRWVAKINGVEVKEWEIGSYEFLGDNRATNSFFQAHHGVQDNWARTRLQGAYNSQEAPTILLRDRHAGSPHQRLTARQVSSERASGVSIRTYQEERALTIADLQIADVPEPYASQFLAAADKYYGDLYRRVQSTLTADQLKVIFGSWKP